MASNVSAQYKTFKTCSPPCFSTITTHGNTALHGWWVAYNCEGKEQIALKHYYYYYNYYYSISSSRKTKRCNDVNNECIRN